MDENPYEAPQLALPQPAASHDSKATKSLKRAGLYLLAVSAVVDFVGLLYFIYLLLHS